MPKKWKAILAGCGGMSKVWLRILLKERDDIEIVALVEPVAENAESRKKEFDFNAPVFSTLPAAFAANPGAELFFDISIPAAHADNAVLALSHHCHVLSEKPLAESTDDGRRIAEAAQKYGRIHAVMQNRRYLDGMVNYRRMIGQLGTLGTLNADFYIGAHFGGFRDAMKHVLLLDMAIHTFDQARFLTGANATKVFCKEWNPAGSWYEYPASAVAIFTMENNLVFTYRGSWCAEGCNTSWECQWRAVGTAGTALWDGHANLTGELVNGSGKFINDTRPLLRNETALSLTGHAGCIDEFIRCLNEGTIPQTVVTDNIHSLAMAEGAIASAESGTEVNLN